MPNANRASRKRINIQSEAGNRIFMLLKRPFSPYCKWLIMWWLQTTFAKAAFTGAKGGVYEAYMPPLHPLYAAEAKMAIMHKFAILACTGCWGALRLTNCRLRLGIRVSLPCDHRLCCVVGHPKVAAFGRCSFYVVEQAH